MGLTKNLKERIEFAERRFSDLSYQVSKYSLAYESISGKLKIFKDNPTEELESELHQMISDNAGYVFGVAAGPVNVSDHKHLAGLISGTATNEEYQLGYGSLWPVHNQEKFILTDILSTIALCGIWHEARDAVKIVDDIRNSVANIEDMIEEMIPKIEETLDAVISVCYRLEDLMDMVGNIGEVVEDELNKSNFRQYLIKGLTNVDQANRELRLKNLKDPSQGYQIRDINNFKALTNSLEEATQLALSFGDPRVAFTLATYCFLPWVHYFVTREVELASELNKKSKDDVADGSNQEVMIVADAVPLESTLVFKNMKRVVELAIKLFDYDAETANREIHSEVFMGLNRLVRDVRVIGYEEKLPAYMGRIYTFDTNTNEFHEVVLSRDTKFPFTGYRPQAAVTRQPYERPVEVKMMVGEWTGRIDPGTYRDIDSLRPKEVEAGNAFRADYKPFITQVLTKLAYKNALGVLDENGITQRDTILEFFNKPGNNKNA